MQQHTGQHVLSAAFDRLLDNRTMSFHLGSESVDHRSRARSRRRPTSNAAWTRPTAWCGRTARWRSALRRRRRPRAAAAQGAGARGTAAPDRGRGLRPVRLRRHPRRAHRRDRADCRDRRGEVSRAAAGSRSSAAAGRCAPCAGTAMPSPAVFARCRCCHTSCRRRLSGYRPTASRRARRSRVCNRSWRSMRPYASSRIARSWMACARCARPGRLGRRRSQGSRLVDDCRSNVAAALVATSAPIAIVVARSPMSRSTRTQCCSSC